VTLRLPVTRLRVGDSVRPEVLALDGGGGTGRAVAGASFAVGAPDVAYVSSSGWIVGVGPGSSRVTARAQGGEFTETVTVEAVVPALASLSAGEEHTCGIAPDGTPYCWGANDRGQVAPGRGPAFRVPLPLPFSGRFTAVAAGGNHTCALRSDGRIVCWGGLESPSGQYRAITAGARHACALAADGTTRCWGANDRGQLGIGSTGGRGASRPVAGDVAFELLASGAEHTCGLLDGRVYCWGSDAAGQTGTGNIQQGYVSQPTEVAGAHEHFVFLTAGTDHTCALTRVGWAFCWGSNEHGQLGDGSKRSRYAPRPVQPAMGGTQLSFSTLSAGGTHTCGVTVRQQLYCWGDNTFGQLGDGTSQSRVVPQRVRGDARYRAVTAGRYHTCALTTGGESRCWGRNEDGQLGDGTRTNRVQGAVPGAVSREP
jgi:alpha-tubulin suppressor-like RCC1 family protein